MRVFRPFASEKPISSSKLLISLFFFLLNLSSICHGEALVRLCGVSGVTSQQSYPQDLWVSSYDTEVLIAGTLPSDEQEPLGTGKVRQAAGP